MLRDEIVYLAHKAAHPAEYPTRCGVLQDAVRQKENVQKFTTPTNVCSFSHEAMEFKLMNGEGPFASF